jgi:CheY-like chemotaxis protein
MTAGTTTILHVEDDPNDTLLLAHAFRKAGVIFEIQAVSDGDQAMEYLRGVNAFSDRKKHPMPQLILLDLKMPRVSGFDVLAWLRANDSFKQLPVVVLSSSNHDADIKRAYDLGAKSYLVKPVGFEALVELVKTLPSLLAQA